MDKQTLSKEALNAHDLATRATSNISDMPGSPNNNIHKLEDEIVRIVDLQNEIGSAVNSLLEIKSQIVESIKQVTDPEGQVVLEERYLCYAKWEDIASELGYGSKWQRERRKFLESNPFCVKCYEEGHITMATVVNHIKPHRTDQILGIVGTNAVLRKLKENS